MSLLDRFAVRAMGLGDTRANGSRSDTVHHAPPGALGSITHITPGLPVFPDQDSAAAVSNVYLRSLYAYRCANAVATKISGLDFMAGDLSAQQRRPGAALGSLLGTDRGAPCPGWSTKMFWRWAAIQYQLLGKFAWALEFADPKNPNSRVVGTWPLLAQYLDPLPNVPLRNRPGSYVGQPDYITQQQQFLATYQAQNQTQFYSAGDQSLFSGFRYQYPGSQDYRIYKPSEVAFFYRPSQSDIRKPESVLQAAGVDLNIHTLLQAFDYSFLKNGAVPATMVVTPPFATDGDRNAFRSQFLSDFSGAGNRGKAMFAEREIEPGELPGEQGVDSVEIKIIGTNQRDSQMDVLRDSKIQDICVAMGVPLSILGDSTRSKFTNMQVDRQNFWETIATNCSEIQDSVNTVLAPRVGPDRGWFDLSAVPELKPPPRFSEQWGPGLVAAELITRDEFRRDYDLPPGADVGLDDQDPIAATPVLPGQSPAPPVDTGPGDPNDPQIGEAIPIAAGGRSVDMLSVARRRREARHAGPDHQHVPSGHATRAVLERLLTTAIRKLLAEQLSTMQSRLNSRRGRSLLASQVFDVAYWERRTVDDLGPLLAELGRDDAWISTFAARVTADTHRRLVTEELESVFSRTLIWEAA